MKRFYTSFFRELLIPHEAWNRPLMLMSAASTTRSQNYTMMQSQAPAEANSGISSQPLVVTGCTLLWIH